MRLIISPRPTVPYLGCGGSSQAVSIAGVLERNRRPEVVTRKKKRRRVLSEINPLFAPVIRLDFSGCARRRTIPHACTMAVTGVVLWSSKIPRVGLVSVLMTIRASVFQELAVLESLISNALMIESITTRPMLRERFLSAAI